MSPRNPLLLWFLGLAVIPVILHFLLRAKPKKLLFPALLLIQKRRRRNVQRMRLRHILLMLMRVGVIVLLVLAVARLTVPSANYAPTVGEFLRLLLIVVVAVGVYFGVGRYWKRKGVPGHVVAHRRSFLATGVGVVAVLLALLVVAWPFQRRIAAAITQPMVTDAADLPAAAVFLFDTSLSMEYRFEGKTRLEIARELSLAHLRSLPSGSQIAVAGTGSANSLRFNADRAVGQSQIDALATQAVSIPLNERLRSAIDLQVDDSTRQQESASGAGEDPFLREVYVFTDLSAHAWQSEASRVLRNEMDRLAALHVYLIDVGIEDPVNAAISDLRLSSQTLVLGNEGTIEATVTATGAAAGKKVVEISVLDGQGKLVKQGSKDVDVPTSAGVQVSFSLHNIGGVLAQGEVRLVAADPLTVDDVRYFTLRVQPPREILVVSDTQQAARFWLQALGPALQKQGKAPYRSTFIKPQVLPQVDLSRYAAVCLIDVAAPRVAGWEALATYLSDGGGVLVVLGSRAKHAAYLAEEAKKILPAELMAKLRFDPPATLDFQNLTHPMLHKFAKWGTGDLGDEEIRMYWKTNADENATVIIPYTDADRSPAVVENGVGNGRVVLVTTGVENLQSWNNLPSAAWWIVFVDQVTEYLGHQSQGSFNYTAGQRPLVRLDADVPLKRYLLRKPGRQQLPGTVEVGAREFLVEGVDRAGHYRLLPLEPEDLNWTAGFSVNADPRESDLGRLGVNDLDALFGEDRYAVAKTFDELERVVKKGRVGVEIFPWLVTVLVLIFVGELLLSNRFYEADLVSEENAAETPEEYRWSDNEQETAEPVVATADLK